MASRANLKFNDFLDEFDNGDANMLYDLDGVDLEFGNKSNGFGNTGIEVQAFAIL